MSTDIDAAGRALETVSAWIDEYDLIGALIPFEYRSSDPLEQFATVARGVDDLASTAATFKSSDILGDIDSFHRGFGASSHLRTMYYLLGAFQCGQTSTGKRWSNPNYCHGSVHLEPWGSTAERVTFAEECAALGTLEISDVARHFGVATSTMRTCLSDAGFEWADARNEGRRRLGRTALTIHEWTGREYIALADLLPISERQLQYCRDEWVADDWTPPADPTTESGITRWRPSRIDADE